MAHNVGSRLTASSCANANDTFVCLQALPISKLYSAIHATAHADVPIPGDYEAIYSPVVDRSFLSDYPSSLMATGQFSKVPALLGLTTDELSLSIPTTLNISTDAQLLRILEGRIILPGKLNLKKRC